MWICIVCDAPPEYCMVDKKDFSECKNWLMGADPDLFDKIYPEEAEGEEKKGIEPPKQGGGGK